MNADFLLVPHGVVAIFYSDLNCRVLKAERTEDAWVLTTDHDNLLVLVEMPSYKMIVNSCKYFGIKVTDDAHIRRIVNMCAEVECQESDVDPDDLPW